MDDFYCGSCGKFIKAKYLYHGGAGRKMCCACKGLQLFRSLGVRDRHRKSYANISASKRRASEKLAKTGRYWGVTE